MAIELKNKYKYALIALLALAKSYPSKEPVQIREMEALQDVPKRYLEPLLTTLRRADLIKSTRGAKGGYVLALDPRKITLGGCFKLY